MGRTKGSKNRVKAIPDIPAPPFYQAKAASRAKVAPAAVNPAAEADPASVDLADSDNEVEILMRKYERGAKLLGLTLNAVDRMMGDPIETFSRRKRWTATGIPLTPAAVALYQRIIPLTEGYIRAESSDDLPDNAVLDMGLIREAESGRAKLVLALERSLRNAGIESEGQVSRAVEFSVVLGYFGMEPKEVFEALMERKNRRAVEEFERKRKELGVSGGEG